MSKPDQTGARTRARELALQALYQAQITGHDKTELLRQFHSRPDYERIDKAYFDELLPAICDSFDSLKTSLDAYADRPIEQLDPVELGVLAIGYYELESRTDVPYRAVIDEAVGLARRFGAEDGYKYVNAVLDKACKALRPAEIG